MVKKSLFVEISKQHPCQVLRLRLDQPPRVMSEQRKPFSLHRSTATKSPLDSRLRECSHLPSKMDENSRLW